MKGFGTVEAPAKRGVWARGVGIFDHSDADAALGSPSSQANTGGFQVGFDHTLGLDSLIGVSGGYTNSSLTVSDRSSSGSSDAIQVGVYGTYAPDSWIFDGSLSYSDATNKMSRNVVFPGVNETAASDFKSWVMTAYGEAGYAFRPTNDLALVPTLGLRESHMHQNGYTETGAPGANLTVEDENSDSIVSSLGLRLSRVFLRKTAHPVLANVRSFWDYNMGDIKNIVSAQFADAANSAFVVQGTPQSRNSLILGLGARMDLVKNLQAFADFGEALSSGKHTEGIQGGLSLRW
jgi:outer membrane autotransporter protein